ncbi:MAG: Ig-like domain-containing protein, partial [Planctomycetaceae bacterium]|nr:Ig-like domain-containing protein [Planctomycetaceae bacterium]
MILRCLHVVCCAVVVCSCGSGLSAVGAERPAIVPERITIDRPEATEQLLLWKTGTADRQVDATREVKWTTVPEGIVRVDTRGRVIPVSDGEARIQATGEGISLSIPVTVSGFARAEPVSFREEIIPILTKARCNSGGCHGKAEGQNGFRLSIFGFDTEADHAALLKESRGRRVSVTSPDDSLLLLKGSARVPHGGGRKIEPGSLRDRRLRRWIAEGARFDAPTEETSTVQSIEIEPADQSLLAGETQQIRVVAVDSTGNRHCVTAEAEFESNAEAIATVDERGLVTAGDVPGEAAVLVRFLGHVSVCRITLPRPGVNFSRPPEQNFIDGHVWNRLERLGIEPSGLS